MLTVPNALHGIAKTYRSPRVRLKSIRTVADSGCAIQATIISLAVTCDDVTGFSTGQRSRMDVAGFGNTARHERDCKVYEQLHCGPALEQSKILFVLLTQSFLAIFIQLIGKMFFHKLLSHLLFHLVEF